MFYFRLILKGDVTFEKAYIALDIEFSNTEYDEYLIESIVSQEALEYNLIEHKRDIHRIEQISMERYHIETKGSYFNLDNLNQIQEDAKNLLSQLQQNKLPYLTMLMLYGNLQRTFGVHPENQS